MPINTNRKFQGYRRENGRVGVRNHVVILPVDDISNACCEAVANNIKGELRVYGTPAEEGGSGKVYMVRDGLFDDVDVSLHWHPGNVNSARQGDTMANVSGKFRFYGTASHAAAAPDNR